MRTLITLTLFLTSCCSPHVVHAIFFQRTQQLCVNAVGLNPAAVPAGQLPPPGSQTQVTCVKCDMNRLQYISALCTGQPVVPSNIAANQAFCLINNCLQQIPQKNSLIPSFGGMGMMGYAGNNNPVGRKRRAATDPKAKKADVIFTNLVSGGAGISLEMQP